jgi:hypothetical protein
MKVRVGPWESPANFVTGAVVTVYANSIDTAQQQPNASDEVCNHTTYMYAHQCRKPWTMLFGM